MNRRIKLYIFIISVILVSFGPLKCWAEYDVIDITKPFLRKIPLAVPLFKNVNETSEEKQLAQKAADFLSDTLEFTGYFKILDRGSFLFDPERSGVTLATINFQNWTVVGAELLITGFYEERNDRISVELRLFDTFKARRVIGKKYTGSKSNQRSIILRFCGDVINYLKLLDDGFEFFPFWKTPAEKRTFPFTGCLFLVDGGGKEEILNTGKNIINNRMK